MAIEGKTRRQALTEFREAEILGAARKVFGEHGFAAATIEMIAAAAGVAKGTLYLYYPSKEEIFWTALSSGFRSVFERSKQEIGRAEGTEAKIRAALRVRFEYWRSDEAFLRMYVTEFGQICGLSNQRPEPLRSLYIESVSYLAEILAEGMRRGELRPGDAMETAMAFMELSKAVFAMRFSGLAGQNPEFDGEKFVFDLFWNGVKA